MEMISKYTLLQGFGESSNASRAGIGEAFAVLFVVRRKEVAHEVVSCEHLRIWGVATSRAVTPTNFSR